MEKVTLPIKTKIAVWLMYILGIVVVISCFVRFIENFKSWWGAIAFGESFVIGVLLFISSYFLLKRRRWAWWLAIVNLSLIIINFSSILVVPLYIALKGGGLPVIKTILDLFFLSLMMLNRPLLELFGIFSPIIIILITSVSLIALYFLFLDRKNFWKIST